MTEPAPDYTATYPDADIVPAQAKQLEAWIRPYLLNERRRTIAKLRDLERMLGIKEKR